MRFLSKKTEEGFLKMQKAFLYRRARLIALLAMCAFVASIFFCTVVGKWHLRETFSTDAAHRAHLVTLMCASALTIILLPVLLALQCERFVDRIGPATLEVVSTFIMLLTMVVIVLSSPANVCSMQGESFTHVHGYASDSGVLMTIDGIVTATHLGLPVRWWVMMPLEVVGVMLYMIIILFVGSPEPLLNSAFNLIFLTVLIAATSVGKRYAELGERKNFLVIINERSRRCEAEFKLSQADSEAPRLRPEEVRSESAPTTAQNSAILNLQMAAAADLGGKLELVKQVAREEHWLIPDGDISIVHDKVLGSGGFGEVVEGVIGGMVCAIKRPKRKRRFDRSNVKELEDICNELRIFRHLRHPHIVAFHGAVIDPDGSRVALVLERIRGETLHRYITGGDNGAGPDVTARYQVLLGICRALLHLHSRNPHVVHSDLKSSNVLVEVLGSDARPKLLDFGLARVLTRGSRTPLGGTMSWMAPEVSDSHAPLRCSADIYSLGHLIAFVATGLTPTQLKPRMGKRQRGRAVLLPSWPPGCVFEPHFSRLVDRCLRFDQAERPSIEDVMQRLLRLPEQLDFRETPGGFLEEVAIVAKQLAQDESVSVSGGLTQETAGTSACSSLANDGLQQQQQQQQQQHEQQRQQQEQQPREQHQEQLTTVFRLPSLPEASLETERKAGDVPPPPPPVVDETRQTSRTPRRWKPVRGSPNTSNMAIQMSLLSTISRWNFELEGSPCCGMHASALVAKKICETIEQKMCSAISLPHGSTQCPCCGILDVEISDNACGICEQRLTMSGVPRSSNTRTAL